jgi:hypothetical protein
MSLFVLDVNESRGFLRRIFIDGGDRGHGFARITDGIGRKNRLVLDAVAKSNCGNVLGRDDGFHSG